MPRITPGVTQAVRSHRVSIPGDERMLAAAAPNACHLCHADKSAAWVIAELAKGWNRTLVPGPGWAAAWNGSLEHAARDVWAKSSLLQTRLILMDVYSRMHD